MAKVSTVDLLGSRFGRLTVLAKSAHRGRIAWLCRCLCGKFSTPSTYELRSGHSRSCGCLSLDTLRCRSAATIRSVIGQTFNRLTVIARTENSPTGGTRWICRCECGGQTITTARELRSGHTRSCGCLESELTSRRSAKEVVAA